MKSPFRYLALLMIALTCSLSAANKCYLFSYFIGNGEDGLHFATSKDGMKWEALRNGASFLKPEVGGKLMRDPCITLGEDGIYRMVWTDSWKGGTIGYASSDDLIHWSPQKSLAVMKDEPTVKNCWAPEVIFDSKRKLFTLFWASTIPGRFPTTEADGKNDSNHRIYATTTKDFETFSPTQLFFDPGFNCIDSTILPFDGKAVMFFKNETKVPQPMKNLCLATAATPEGPWLVESAPITPKNSWVEGPSALKTDDGIILYFDAYTKGHYCAMKSGDLKSWKDVTDQLVMPKGIRHGTAFEVSPTVLEGMCKP